MKTSELIEKLSKLDQSLMINYKEDDLKIKSKFEVYEVKQDNDKVLHIDFSQTDFEIFYLDEFIKELETNNKHNYDIGYAVWMDGFGEQHLNPINLTWSIEKNNIIFNMEIIIK